MFSILIKLILDVLLPLLDIGLDYWSTADLYRMVYVSANQTFRQIGEEVNCRNYNIDNVKSNGFMNNTGIEYKNNTGIEYMNNTRIEYMNNTGIEYVNNTRIEYMNNTGIEYMNNTGIEYMNNTRIEYMNNTGSEYMNNTGIEYMNNTGSDYMNDNGYDYMNNNGNDYFNSDEIDYPQYAYIRDEDREYPDRYYDFIEWVDNLGLDKNSLCYTTIVETVYESIFVISGILICSVKNICSHYISF